MILEKPEVVIEEESVAFDRQERPTSDLLLGERRLVQAGQAGQIRRFFEVDGKGNRMPLQTEVVKEAVTEIVEVGTKVVPVAPEKPELPNKVVPVTPEKPELPNKVAPVAPDKPDLSNKVVPVETEKPEVSYQVVQPNKQGQAKAEPKLEQASKQELPNTGTVVDENLVALGLAGVFSGFGLLAQKKKEE